MIGGTPNAIFNEIRVASRTRRVPRLLACASHASHLALYSVLGLRDALAPFVHDAKIKLRAGKALVSGEPVPLDSSGIVLRDAFALVVHEAEKLLCDSVALVSGEA
jgi:hypothetical protein